MERKKIAALAAGGWALMSLVHFGLIRPPTMSVYVAQSLVYFASVAAFFSAASRNKIPTVFFGRIALKILFWAVFFYMFYSAGHAVKSSLSKIVLIDFAALYLIGEIFEVWTAVLLARSAGGTSGPRKA